MEPQKEYYTIFRNADNHAKSPHCCRFFFTKFTVFKEKDTAVSYTHLTLPTILRV